MKKREYTDIITFIRHRKIGDNELYVYQDYMSGKYVVQQQYKNQMSWNIGYDTKLDVALMVYGRAKEALMRI